MLESDGLPRPLLEPTVTAPDLTVEERIAFPKLNFPHGLRYPLASYALNPCDGYGVCTSLAMATYSSLQHRLRLHADPSACDDAADFVMKMIMAMTQ